MAFSQRSSHAFSFLGQSYAAVFFVKNKLFCVEPVEHSCDRGRPDVEMACYVDWFRVSFFPYELVDDLYIVFVSGSLASGARLVCSRQFCKLAFSFWSSGHVSGTLGFGQLVGYGSLRGVCVC